MKLFTFIFGFFGKVQTKHFLGMKNAARWERVGSFSVAVQKRAPHGIHCAVCSFYSPVPDERTKGICKRYSAKNVVLLVRGTDERTCYSSPLQGRPCFARLRLMKAIDRRVAHARAA